MYYVFLLMWHRSKRRVVQIVRTDSQEYARKLIENLYGQPDVVEILCQSYLPVLTGEES
jgi:hypothetical protein